MAQANTRITTSKSVLLFDFRLVGPGKRHYRPSLTMSTPSSTFERASPFTPASGLVRSLDFCIDDHGSLLISRSASVRPNHLFDPYFDHDYFFGLPFVGSGMPHQVDGVLLPTMDVSELSRVRTALTGLRILAAIPPHPIQLNRHPAPHRYLGNALVSTHRQVNVATSPVRMDSCRRLGCLHQQEAQ